MIKNLPFLKPVNNKNKNVLEILPILMQNADHQWTSKRITENFIGSLQ